MRDDDMKKAIGILMILSIFVGLFIFMDLDSSIYTALAVFAGVACFMGFVFVAVELIVSDN